MSLAAKNDPLYLAELSAIIEEATSDARHGLRNKLGSIRNAAYYVRRRLQKTEAWTADPRLDVMASLVDTDVAGANELVASGEHRLHERRLATVDLRTCVLDAVEHARVLPSIRLHVDATSAPARVDAAELTVAVRCLVENAAEATPHEGHVHVRGFLEGRSYRIDVMDRGPGIAETALQAAFGAFYTTKQGHAGLGLTIARRIALRYGGKLVVGAAGPAGATVSLVLDVAEEAPDADRAAG